MAIATRCILRARQGEFVHKIIINMIALIALIKTNECCRLSFLLSQGISVSYTPRMKKQYELVLSGLGMLLENSEQKAKHQD